MRCNTVTFTAADGHRVALPLQALVERGAVVATKVNGQDVLDVMGAANQLWVPGLPAKYFVRDIVGIRFTEEEEPPAIPAFEDDGRDFTNRPNVAIKAAYAARDGSPMLLEGWAEDYDKAIAAVEISLDGGETWTACPTEGATAGRWVWWRFEYVPRGPGRRKALARAVNEDGKRSPTPAAHFFEVLEEG